MSKPDSDSQINSLALQVRRGVSASGKVWRFPSAGEPAPELIAAADGSTVLARLLMARGLDTDEAVRSFLNMENYVPTDPMELPDVDRAIVRINKAIAEQEHITVYGDYDVDGVTGTSVLLTVLRSLGASVDFYIPNRAGEGYGLNLKAVSILASKHRTKLIITCDCGVSNFAEINFAKGLGVETLVLDHHTMPELLPPAVGVIHPKRLDESHPLFHLPGVGVAYKVCEALLVDRNREHEVPLLLDYLTLGLIADMVPLIRENRYLVKIGLPALSNSSRPGIKALLSQVGKFEDTDLVGFGLAPRINAVGRLSDAKAAVELLTTESEDVANELAKQLQTENARRQELCETIFAAADRMVTKKFDLSKDKAIAIYDEDWHHGVVGIVASRLVEKYHRPVFIAELDSKEGIVKGSARSVDGIDLYEVLKANEHLLVKFGGHKMAAGFSMEAAKAEAACRALVETCNRLLIDKSTTATLDIDIVVSPDDLDLEVARVITKLAPFGMNNKKPVFCVRGLTCSASRPLGKEGKHSRIMVINDTHSQFFECVMWNSRGRVPSETTAIDIAFTPEVNNFNGRERLQLVLSDWRAAVAEGDLGANLDPLAAPDSVPSKTPAEIIAGHPRAIPVPAPDAGQQQERELIAARAQDRSEILNVRIPTHDRSASIISVKQTWKDLRTQGDPLNILERAMSKLGSKLGIFGESCDSINGVKLIDRSNTHQFEHLIFWQFPPSAKLFQEILARSGNCQVYMLGAGQTELDDASRFLKRLFGLVRYAISKRNGEVEGEKLAIALGATKMSVALGLTVLRKANIIDWFSEDGKIFLDLIGEPVGEAEELPEYKQLAASLTSTRQFREWCTFGRLEEVQLAVTPNRIAEKPEGGMPGDVETDTSREEN